MQTKELYTIILSLLLLLFSSNLQARQEPIPVFVSGTNGYNSFRIPAIIILPNNELLAFCEGRVKSDNDFGDINIVMKRSADKGKTWSTLQTIVDNDSLQAGNPAPVVDLHDPAFPNGRIFLFYNTGNNHEGEIRKGNGIREVWYKTSTDNGKTWSEATNISTSVHRPKQPKINQAYNFAEDWRSYANTPGHAIQFLQGKYQGRIYVPANHSAGSPQLNSEDYDAHGFYTDDHGRSFHLSQSIQVPGSNESTVALISNNRLLLNARNQKGDIKARIIAISNDGGSHWDRTYFDRQLSDPICQGSILSIGNRKGKTILAFSNNADTINRNNLTIRISFDEGKSWKKSFLIDTNPNSADQNNDYTAYSDLVKIDSSRVGILYEKKNYSTIEFAIKKWK
jgi:sialidase-1